MVPADTSPESPKKPEPQAVAAFPEFHGQNGLGEKKHGIWPFEGPQPYKLTPEDLESLRHLWTEEVEVKAAADLRDILENGGGISSAEFLRAIEQAASENG
jgi:alkanesulfonate monooxygenase SsuD/methylene tetrahydromethanopterin reductase-like flavin-dependent oxidoreductase (luciferase family)